MIYFLIPIFNEENNLELLSQNLSGALNDAEKFYVFSDDGSSDGSRDKIAALFKKDQYVILGDGSNHGPGFAFNTGFEWILNHSKNDSDRIVTMEADNTSDLTILPNMLAISQLGYDLVLASVYAQGGGFDKTSLFRKLASSVANLILRYFFDIKVLTLSSFYRVYSLKLLRRIKLTYTVLIKEDGFISMIEILIKAIRSKGSIIEVPMTLHSGKRQGKSKMKLLKTTMSYGRFLLGPKS